MADLQQFSELYRESVNGYVKPPQMPGELRSHLLVRIPPYDLSSTSGCSRRASVSPWHKHLKNQGRQTIR
ncbi:MAG: hypothetical protein F6J95_029335 [Leptolyngbya sp. SIO1E4]|nr:hypothetical protein [Leptolyngbya sp. SIO1E4]